jgi:rubrerythrin
MEQTMKLGTNKTGIDMSPIHTKEMLEAIENTPVVPAALVQGEQTLKQTFIEEAGPLGSVPLPGTVKGVAKSLLKTITGHHPEVFINKLGERLAYERSGVRIYDALIAKCQHTITSGMIEQKIDIATMQRFREEEAQHFELLVANIKKLGADPTAQTPDADAIGVASSGLMKVITDPRTSISQSLEAMLAIELADNAAWELVITLAEDMGFSTMAEEFRAALRQEDVHLATVKSWYEELVRSQATSPAP